MNHFLENKKVLPALKNIGQKHHKLLLSISLFFVAFLPRAIYAVSPNVNWYGRSIRFWDAILSQNWVETYQQYHPGVTTMWLSGLGIRIFGWFRGYSSEELLDFQTLPAGVFHQAMSAGVIPLAIGISLGIVLTYLLLAKLTNKWIALTAAFFIALDPFHISQSKSLHLDAIMSVLMLVTILLLLYYRKQKRNWILVVAGLFTGFSLLTKSPTAILIPIGVLIITSSHNFQTPKDNDTGLWRVRLSWLSVVFQKLALWGLAATAVFFVFWPAMWVAPQEMLLQIRDSVLFHALNPHPNVIYFNGNTTTEDPGVIYYGAVVLLQTTLITFPLLLAGIGKLFWEIRTKRASNHLTILWLLLFGVIFLLQMLASAKKGDRYILPVFLTVDLLAGFGLVHLGNFISRRSKVTNRNLFLGMLVGGALILQAGIILPVHPYYSNSYNFLFGGIKQAQEVLGLQYHSEGIDLAGQYLNTFPDASQTTVSIYDFGSDMLNQHFGGIVEIGGEDFLPDADYRVYYASQITRGLGGAVWMNAWETDQLREPEHIVTFNDIPYVWIYEVTVWNE